MRPGRSGTSGSFRLVSVLKTVMVGSSKARASSKARTQPQKIGGGARAARLPPPGHLPHQPPDIEDGESEQRCPEQGRPGIRARPLPVEENPPLPILGRQLAAQHLECALVSRRILLR